MFQENEFKDKSICTVGNAPSILHKENGKLIDSHDYVIRFNRYDVENYTKNTGKKTDIWVTNFDTITHTSQEHKFSTTSKVYILGAYQDFDGTFNKFEPYVTKFLKYQNTSFVSKQHLKDIENFNRTKYIFTSGLVTIISLIEFCNIPKLYITGFDFLKNKRDLHYFEKCERVDLESKHRKHDSDVEKQIVEEYIRNGRITII